METVTENHEIGGCKLQLSADDDEPKKPVLKKRTRKQPEIKPNDNDNQVI